jgi:hypothetical protein
VYVAWWTFFYARGRTKVNVLKILGTIIQYLVAWVTRCPGIVQPWSKSTVRLRDPLILHMITGPVETSLDAWHARFLCGRDRHTVFAPATVSSLLSHCPVRYGSLWMQHSDCMSNEQDFPTHFHPVLKLRMIGAIPSLPPPYTFMVCTRTVLPVP